MDPVRTYSSYGTTVLGCGYKLTLPVSTGIFLLESVNFFSAVGTRLLQNFCTNVNVRRIEIITGQIEIITGESKA
jgi:hypothetical protein